MMRGTLTIFTFISVVLFPWPLSVALGVAAAFVEPFVPLAAGIFADALYLTPHAFPVFALGGAACSGLAFFVRSRLRTGIME